MNRATSSRASRTVDGQSLARRTELVASKGRTVSLGGQDRAASSILWGPIDPMGPAGPTRSYGECPTASQHRRSGTTRLPSLRLVTTLVEDDLKIGAVLGRLRVRLIHSVGGLPLLERLALLTVLLGNRIV